MKGEIRTRSSLLRALAVPLCEPRVAGASPYAELGVPVTLEAWVNPLTVNRAWRDVIYKGDDNYRHDRQVPVNRHRADGGGRSKRT